MAEERFLVTGALGCIGAWVVRNLVQEGVPTTVFDLDGNPHRLKLIMSENELAQVKFITGDIVDLDSVQRAVQDSGATHVVHLAALQIPFCRANPTKGALVNVVGTVNVFEAVKSAGIRHLVYASSAGVYGPRDVYPAPVLPHDAPLDPRHLYGVYKQANEGTARVYWWENGVPSIGLRPYTIYGPGRDQGMTSTPTKAMLAAAAGQSYRISYGGYNGFQYTDDTAKIFIRAARVAFEGAEVFNIKGTIAHMREVVEAIETAEPVVRGKITFDETPLAISDGMDDVELVKIIGPIQYVPLKEGVARTIARFKQAIAEGKLKPEVI